MANMWIGNLIAQLHAGTISRREFAQRAGALGLSATLVGQALRVAPAAAQESSPAAGDGQIGMPGIEHVTDTSKGMIKLYSSWPMIAQSEQIGGDSREAIVVALEDFGSAAGGFALEYEALDDAIASTGAWDPGKEAENSNLVLNDEDAMIYIATYNSGAAKIAIPIMNQGPMAMISPANTYPGLTVPYDEGEPDVYYPANPDVQNYMRVCPNDIVQGGASANWAYNTLGARRAYVLHDNQIYGRGVADVFQNSFVEMGGEVLGFEGYDVNAPDYQALMTSIAADPPDLVYLGAIVNLNAGKLLIDMRSVMPADQVTFLGPDGLINQAFIDAAGQAAEGAYITFGGLPPGELKGIGAEWATRMQERVAHVPDAYSAYAYEAAVACIQAIDQVGEKDRLAILDALLATEGFNGLIGTWSFDENGDTTNDTVSLNVVTNGEITFQEEIAVAG